MSAKVAYRVTITYPGGSEKTCSPAPRKRDAATTVMGTMYYGANLAKSAANRFAARVEDAPLGETVTHESGYAFRIDACPPA